MFRAPRPRTPCPRTDRSASAVAPHGRSHPPNRRRFITPNRSSTYKSLFPQLVYFLIDTKPRGCPPPRSVLCGLSSLPSHVFSTAYALFGPNRFCKALCSQPLHSLQKTSVGAPPTDFRPGSSSGTAGVNLGQWRVRLVRWQAQASGPHLAGCAALLGLGL
jgi:hypothetical protein